MRARPHAGYVGGDRSLGLKLGDLPLERGRYLSGNDLSGARVPISGDALGFGAPDEGIDNAVALLRIRKRKPKLTQRLVDQEIGRDEPLSPG
jgi:hypothetical protein